MYRITETQLGMFLEWNANRSSLQYNIAGMIRLPKTVDLARLEEACRATVLAHEVLTARFVECDGTVMQEFDAKADIPCQRLTLKSEAEAEEWSRTFPKPFDLLKGGLVRFAFIDTPSAKFFGFDISHLVFDGSSMRMFNSEIAARYEGKAIPAEGAAYADFAAAEEASFASAAYAEAAADHRTRFAGLSATLPEDQFHDKVAAKAGSILVANRSLAKAPIIECCKTLGVSPNLFFSGVFARVLSAFANERKVVFCTVNHGRRDATYRNTIGACIKTLPVLGEVNGEKSLKEYFESFKIHRAGVYPFTHCVRDIGLLPGFMFIFQDGTTDFVFTLEGVDYTYEMLGGAGVSENPAIEIYGAGEGDEALYDCRVSCMAGKYSQRFLDQLCDMIETVAHNFVAHAESRLGDIPLLDADEIAALTDLAYGGDLAYDDQRTFPELVGAHAAARPQSIALVDCETTVSYGELWRRSDELAEELRASGVGPGGFVGLMLPRRVSFPIAALAVQKCAAGYVPIDPEYPADRIAYMLADSEAPVLVTTRELYAGKPLDFGGKVIFFEEQRRSRGERPANPQSPTPNPQPITYSLLPITSPQPPTPASPAYMIYTSGSTGRPKGVVLPQRAVVNMCAWTLSYCGVTAADRIATHPSFSFDASVIDIFPALAAGAELHLYSEDIRKDLPAMRDYILAHKITGGTMSTQIGMALIDTYPDLPLRYVILGGEKLLPTAKTAIRIVNGYGPTEFCVCSSLQTVDQSMAGEIPIGRPVPNTYSFICDPLGQLLPRGMQGELCLSGIQIADGYWHQAEKTAKAFVACGFSKDGKMYRTGDYARYDERGLLEYRGRIDFQVKLRGFRIEIGEIEHAAAACEGVTAAIAMVKELAGAQHLVLYYTGSADAEGLKAKMSETLTGYMVPDYFVRLAAMPMTPVGKIDRKALPLPELSDEPAVPPASECEAKILELVRAVLKTDRFGVTHDFNRLGLTSLGAMTLIARLRAEAGIALTMRQLVDAPTVRQLAALAGKGDAASAAPKKRRPRRSHYPMSENQRGVYADWLRDPEATQYNVPAAIRFPELDPERLAAAARRVFDAHPAFKTRFVEKDGEIVQLRRDDYAIEVPVETVRENPDAAFFARVMRPFSPQDGDLVRAIVYAAPNGAYLFLDVHHTVFDGFSLGVFIGELMRVLEGGEPKGEVATSFDAALDERDYLESELLAEDDAWFAKYLEGCESTRVETSASGAAGKPGQCARVSLRTPAAAIARRSGELAVSASDWFLTAFMELLRRVGRSDDVQITFVSAGRANPCLADTVGMFVRTLPVRNVRDTATFSETVRRIRNDVRDLIDRDRYSYARAAERLGLRPEVIFAFEGGLFDLPFGAELIAPPLGTVKCPLSVLVTPGRDDFELAFEYDASLYSEADMRALLAMFETLAQNAATCDELRALPLVPSETAAALTRLSYGGEIEYDLDKTFVDVFRGVAVARPFATAVVDCDDSITYGELDEQSDALAAKLREDGVFGGGFVGLMLPRRLSFIVSLLAVQKCAAGYVPIDPEYPADRIAYMLADSEAPVLVTTRELYAGKQLDFGGKVIFFEEWLRSRGENSTNPQPPTPIPQPITYSLLPITSPQSPTPNPQSPTPASPAYMIYTSGSTGRPKGVVLPHRALRHLCVWMQRDCEITYADRIATHPSFSFDASVIDIFPALSAGAELHLYSEAIRKDLPAMRDYIVSHSITGGVMSTQIGMALIDTYPDLPLRYTMLGGEKLLPTTKTAIRIINGYGPTEFCVCSSMQTVDQSMTGDIPIGRAVPGTYSYIVDRYGHLLPQGYAGEIALAGPQIADGYWHNPEKTAAAFVERPFGDGGRMYRTGDLARYNSDGLIDYLGRIDFQVKLRGFRIEIGEIEHAASQFPGVRTAAAEVRDVGGAKHLVLYYAAEGAVDEGALKTQMSGSLAAYMVPDFFVRMDAMPMTPNGKINRKALPVPSAAAAEEFVVPRPGVEADIAKAYAEILKTERFGATTDFFLAGGTSLLGIKAVVALQKRGLDVQYGDLFKYKTPRDLASFLSGEKSVAACPGGAFDYGAYDYSAIDAMLGATRSDLFDGFKVHSLGDVLLTGATGYLGIHVLRYLLERTSSSVTVLIRPKRNQSAERRLDSQCVYYFGQRLERRLRDRVSFVEGDITDADLEQKLSAMPIHTVINCAALVKHYIADDAMDRVNVGGVENLIAWCSRANARLIQTSTYSIGGMVSASSPAVLSERTLFVGQTSDNDYVRTKFLAERAVLAAVAAGKLRGKVMRLGNLMGREVDGEFQMNVGANAFVNSLKSYRALGVFPLEELASRIEMSPIDRVAEAVCLLATTPDDMTVFHPFNCYALDMGAVLGAMNRRGYAVDWVSRGEFAAHVDALRNDPTRAKDLQGILHYASRHLADNRMTPVVNDFTTTVLYRLGFRWKAAEDAYLANFFDVLEGLAVFD